MKVTQVEVREDKSKELTVIVDISLGKQRKRCLLITLQYQMKKIKSAKLCKSTKVFRSSLPSQLMEPNLVIEYYSR